MKILIADDNIRIRNLINRLIGTVIRDYDVFECSDGYSAVKINRNECPDLILMDILMPVMDGLTAARNIHAEQPLTKIIIISELSDLEYRSASFNAGAIDFIHKGQLFELPDKLKSLIEGQIK